MEILKGIHCCDECGEESYKCIRFERGADGRLRAELCKNCLEGALGILDDLDSMGSL